MNKLKEILFVLTHPSFWLMNYTYSKIWDEELKRLISEYKFEYIDHYSAKIGRYEMWVANYPYAAFTCPFAYVRPKRYTIKLAYDKLISDLSLREVP